MSRQQGFTLVELMVALVLGLLITAVAFQLFASNNRLFQFQRSLSQTQESGRMLRHFLVSDLRQSGYVRDDVLATRPMGIQFTSYTGAGNRLFPPASEGNFDRLTLAFNGSSDCEGDAVATAQEVVNSYYVKDGGLYCEGSLDGSSQGELLVAGVEAFEVMYGIDSNKDGEPQVDRYVNANGVGGNPVVAVRVGFLLSSTTPVAAAGAGADSYYVLNREIDNPEDNRLRRVFTATVQARNPDWDGV